MEEDVLYTDYYGIKITSKNFYYEGKMHPLHKIDRINLKRSTPQKYLDLLLFMSGLSAILIGAFDVAGMVNINIADNYYTLNLDLLWMAIGVIITFAAIVRIMFAKGEYVVEVRLKGGKEERLTADNRKYAARLVATLKRAYYRQNTGPDNKLLVEA